MPQVAISSNLSLTLTEEQWQAIESAIFAGQNIAAIKLVRGAVPGSGLAEAKSYIEKMTSDLRQKQPEKFTVASSSGTLLGVGAVILFLIVTAVVIFFFLRK